jgi:uncharacterized protein YbjT (DUF2867 family)
MENQKHIFVTGITGNQGSAVAAHLLAGGHMVTGLTRNAGSEKARQWKDRGAAIIEGDLDDPSVYQADMAGSDALFLIQSKQSKQSEIRQAKKFIDAARSGDVKHFVYTSVLGADLNTGVPHFDSKQEIEQYLVSSGLEYTIVRPASFYENNLIPQVADGIRKGRYMTPLNRTCRQQLIGVEDIGKIVAQVISGPDRYAGRILSIATDEIEIGDLPELFSEALNRPVKFRKLPGLIVRLAMGKDLHKMFRYMNQHNFCVVDNIREVRDEFQIKGDFRAWVHKHFKPKVDGG